MFVKKVLLFVKMIVSYECDMFYIVHVFEKVSKDHEMCFTKSIRFRIIVHFA